MVSLLISTFVVAWVAIAAVAIQTGYLDNAAHHSSHQLERLTNLLMGHALKGGERGLSPVLIPVRGVHAEQHFRP
ncbi:hypothetical protein IQ260_02305 [Leptolyngbya cf. ectocarpi LEGE 11479]|uniref:Uncharacterized protein n=1 Tax=Leptolyngbya cf. ectocarpi LEGE 11479 TaxID=1828722 RepID=A0A928X091_LEPEC|nr:hypothetical protein [Leptolyngbya ectocarpi]MBE9065481.1 hypothetical protein [Leptolyngbya cf. ectocarpi LEGE 11479]